MKSIIILYSFLFIFALYVKCEKKEGKVRKSKKIPSLPYFRRKVEELGDADFFQTTETDDPQNLVSFLVKNVKEIFKDIVETPEAIEKEKNLTLKRRPPILFVSNMSAPPRSSLSTVIIRPLFDFLTLEDMSTSSVPTSTHTTDLLLSENLSLTTLLDTNQTRGISELNTRNEFMKLAKDLKFFTKDKKERDIPGRANTTESDVELGDPRRSCIQCNNVATEECNDPKNKL